jgi:CheY-like chemotaxis protein
LTVTLPPEPIMVEGDKTRLAQVVGNLLNNAAKYTEESGHIWLTLEQGPVEAMVRVRDSGIGIPAELLPRVFDLFTQGDRSLARSEGGLGIGLTLVKTLVEMHGGSVEAISEGQGKGSEIIVRLPILERRLDRRQGKGEPRIAPDHHPSRRILVVDDNQDAAESLAILLGLSGHEVRTVYDGLVALETAKEFQPEVILLDIGLPRISGYEVARRLREQVGLKKAKIVAVTGYGQEVDRRHSQEAGFDAHLTKPADLAALHEILATGETRLS